MFDSGKYYVKWVFATAVAEKSSVDVTADHFCICGDQLPDPVGQPVDTYPVRVESGWVKVDV
jgi:hypothetical protein